MTATNSWGPTPTEEVGREVDYQVAAPTEREHPPGTERISFTKECGWKDGDRGGLAEWEQTHGKKKEKVCLDINRPSHGRSYKGEGAIRSSRMVIRNPLMMASLLGRFRESPLVS